jgi:hypothetical protein
MKNLKTKIEKWYTSQYPTDDEAEYLNSDSTFEGLNKRLDAGKDIYSFIFTDGRVDSLIRERLFSNLAETLGVDYRVVYDKWLNAE